MSDLLPSLCLRLVVLIAAVALGYDTQDRVPASKEGFTIRLSPCRSARISLRALRTSFAGLLDEQAATGTVVPSSRANKRERRIAVFAMPPRSRKGVRTIEPRGFWRKCRVLAAWDVFAYPVGPNGHGPGTDRSHRPRVLGAEHRPQPERAPHRLATDRLRPSRRRSFANRASVSGDPDHNRRGR